MDKTEAQLRYSNALMNSSLSRLLNLNQVDLSDQTDERRDDQQRTLAAAAQRNRAAEQNKPLTKRVTMGQNVAVMGMVQLETRIVKMLLGQKIFHIFFRFCEVIRQKMATICLCLNLMHSEIWLSSLNLTFSTFALSTKPGQGCCPTSQD
uniref:Uncharacterized protein n=2 Tax=Meloidogyne TaxID=189290 RepID=A0A6V7Y2Y9_MELEN|nr:unnamed protein product [Meloidogyne enterolobii]